MQEAFDVVSLAEYLHLNVPQVVRMAERDKLPGRKIGGEWRFAPAEIHHWLEDRIGASAEAELVEVEQVLSRAAEEHEPNETLAELIPLESVAMPLAAKTRESVLLGMVDLANRSGLLWDSEKLANAVRAREGLHPTALDNGVALLHPRRPLANVLAQSFLAIGRTERGIPFGHSRGFLTDVFVLICATSDRDHLRILARLSRLLGVPDFLSRLRAATDVHTVRDLFREWEAKLD